MSPSAVSAALGLLRKVLPDLAAVEYSGSIVQKPVSQMTDAEIDAELARTAAQIRAATGEEEAPTGPAVVH
jgi:FKBP-type peptidyl-prolyl cis-trans isomerase (trigger factor)